MGDENRTSTDVPGRPSRKRTIPSRFQEVSDSGAAVGRPRTEKQTAPTITRTAVGIPQRSALGPRTENLTIDVDEESSRETSDEDADFSGERSDEDADSSRDICDLGPDASREMSDVDADSFREMCDEDADSYDLRMEDSSSAEGEDDERLPGEPAVDTRRASPAYLHPKDAQGLSSADDENPDEEDEESQRNAQEKKQMERLTARTAEQKRSNEERTKKGKKKRSTSPSSLTGTGTATAAAAAVEPPKRNPLLVAVNKVLQARSHYDKWPGILLCKICTKRGFRKMSVSKDKDRMAKILRDQDGEKNRTSPHLDDVRKIQHTLQRGDSPARGSLKSVPPRTAIPSGLVIAVRRLLGTGARRCPSRILEYDRKSFKMSEVTDIIDKEDRAVSGGGGGSGGAGSCAGSGGGDGSASAAARPTGRKGKHCLLRLVSIMVSDRHRPALLESRLQASRTQLDNKEVGSNQNCWVAIADDFRNKDLNVPRLFNHPIIDNCDPNVIEQPDITAQKLTNMWAQAKSSWNPKWANYKSESGNHAAWTDFCGADRDVYIVGAAVELYPELDQICTNLLPTGVQREDAGTGDGAGSRDLENAAALRAAAKREASSLFEKTKAGQRKLQKAARTTAAAAATEKAVKTAVSSAMADVIPALRPPESAFRSRIEEAESKSASLALAQEQEEAHEKWSEKLRKEEDKGDSGNAFRKAWLTKKISELEATMG